MDKVLDKIVKQLEAVKQDVAALKEGKLGWRMGVVILGAVLAFFYAELKETHEIAIANSIQIEQTREIAKEAREVAIENSKKLDQLLILNQARNGADNATTNKTQVHAPFETPNLSQKNQSVPL